MPSDGERTAGERLSQALSELTAGERLSRALSELAAGEAPALVREATERARERVLAELTEALSAEMREAVRRQLAPSAPLAPAVPAAPAADQGETAIYVYGIAPAGARVGELPPGIGDAPVHALSEGDLSALVSAVALADFDEEQLRAHLADMRWVEMTARRHEEVLEAVSATTTVVPMRMCTVYGREDGVRELLHEQAAPFRNAIAHLEGRTEWGVKVFSTGAAGPAAEPASDAEPAPDAEPSSGAEYLQRRRRQRDARARAAHELDAAAATIHERLSNLSVEHTLVPAQRSEVSGRATPMVLNGVYLVEDRAAREFHELADELGHEFAALGLELELTGPWPPYHFVPEAIGVSW